MALDLLCRLSLLPLLPRYNVGFSGLQYQTSSYVRAVTPDQALLAVFGFDVAVT